MGKILKAITVDCDFFVVKIFSYNKRKIENYFYEILLLNEISVKYVFKILKFFT